MDGKKVLSIVGLGILLAGATLTISFRGAMAEEKKSHFAIVYPGGPGSTSQAKSAMRKFSQVLGQTAGQTVKATYFPREREGVKFIESHSPPVAIVSPGFYLKYKEKYKLKIQFQARRKGKTKKKYLLLVRRDSSFQSAKDLAGKVVVSNHFGEKKFLSLALFGQGNKLEKDYQLLSYPRYFRALRKVLREQTINGKTPRALLLDSLQWQTILSHNHLKKRYADKMRIIAESSEVPTMTVVTLGKEEGKILRALKNFGQKKEEKNILQLFGMDEFVSAEKKLYEKLEKLWEKSP